MSHIHFIQECEATLDIILYFEKHGFDLNEFKNIIEKFLTYVNHVEYDEHKLNHINDCLNQLFNPKYSTY